MSEVYYDTVILGGGPIGLCAAYYSASAGKKTLLLERNKFHNEIGSSGGNSRFFRIMYSEKNLSLLAESSYALWKQLETKTRIKLIDERPLLFFGSKNPRQTVEGDFTNTDKVMSELGIPFETLNAGEIKNRYQVFKELPENYVGLIQHNSGVIQVQNSLRAFYNLALNAGADLVDNTPAEIKEIYNNGKTIVVKTPTQTIRTGSLILSLGSWTNEVLAPLGVQFALKIWQMTICYFKVENPTLDYPFWYEFGEPVKNKQNLFYGFPVATDMENCIKVSCDFTNDIYQDVNSCSRNPDPELVKTISEHVAKRFRGVDAVPINLKTCLYTMSEDYRMILGLLPGYKNISILTGESGRAFKYAPLFGRILSQLAHRAESSYNIECLSINRNGILKSK